jgi:hypothetical protein
VRQRNSKIYDSRISELANFTSNGGDFLKSQIHDSEIRLQQVKSGMLVNDLVPEVNQGYFIPALEPYFKGIERRLRKQERSGSSARHSINEQSSTRHPTFFITEPA